MHAPVYELHIAIWGQLRQLPAHHRWHLNINRDASHLHATSVKIQLHPSGSHFVFFAMALCHREFVHMKRKKCHNKSRGHVRRACGRQTPAVHMLWTALACCRRARRCHRSSRAAFSARPDRARTASALVLFWALARADQCTPVCLPCKNPTRAVCSMLLFMWYIILRDFSYGVANPTVRAEQRCRSRTSCWRRCTHKTCYNAAAHSALT